MEIKSISLRHKSLSPLRSFLITKLFLLYKFNTTFCLRLPISLSCHCYGEQASQRSVPVQEIYRLLTSYFLYRKLAAGSGDKYRFPPLVSVNTQPIRRFSHDKYLPNSLVFQPYTLGENLLTADKNRVKTLTFEMFIVFICIYLF